MIKKIYKSTNRYGVIAELENGTLLGLIGIKRDCLLNSLPAWLSELKKVKSTSISIEERDFPPNQVFHEVEIENTKKEGNEYILDVFDDKKIRYTLFIIPEELKAFLRLS